MYELVRVCVSLHTPTHQQAMSCTPDISSRGLLSKYLGNGCLHSCARQTRCVLTEKLGTFVVGWDRVELTAAFPPSPSVGPSTPTPVLPPGCAWEHAAAASSWPQAVPAPAGAQESQRGSLNWSAAKLAAGKLSSGALWCSHYVQELACFGWALVEPLGALAPNACEHMNTAHHCLLLSPQVEMPCFATAVNAKVLSLCVFLILLCFVSSFFQSTWRRSRSERRWLRPTEDWRARWTSVCPWVATQKWTWASSLPSA